MSLEDDLKDLRIFGSDANSSEENSRTLARGLLRVYCHRVGEGKNSPLIQSLRREIEYISSVKGRVRQMIYVLGIGFSNEGLRKGEQEKVLYFLEYLAPSEKPQVLAIPIRDIKRLEKI